MLLLLPKTGGDGGGVPIVANPGSLPNPLGLPDGTVYAVASDGSVRQVLAGAWEIVGHVSVVFNSSDTNSINTTISSNSISSDLILSTTSPAATFSAIQLQVLTDGLRAQIANSVIRGLFSILDTDTIDFSYNSTTGEISGVLKISASAASSGNVLLALDSQSDGLRAQLPLTTLYALFGVTDSSTIDLGYLDGVFTAALKLSSAATSANNQTVSLIVETEGLRAQIPNASIRSLLSILDTDTIDFSYNATSGEISGVIKISAASAAADNLLVALDSQTDGLRAQISFSSIRGIVSASLPLSYNATTGQFLIADASESDSGVVNTSDQVLGNGKKTFQGAIQKRNDTTNNSAVSSIIPESNPTAIANNLSAVFTFSNFQSGTSSAMFVVSTNTFSVVCVADFATTRISFLSDFGNNALIADAGVGLFISKSASSDSVTIKNRLGVSASILVQPMVGSVSATAWA
jgi:hypothetical protein